jgi:regulator of protease activity HflC (stomatin/prohibitin superfamily)
MSRTPIEGERVGDDAVIARSADGQEVAIDCSIIYQIIPEQAVRIHIEWQDRYQNDLVRAVTRGVIRSVASNYTAEEINSDKRQDLEQQINALLRETFQDKGFNLDRFVLRNIAFSPEFAAAIERKQVEQEGVIRSQYEAEQIRQVAEGRGDEVRIQADAEAEAIRLKAEAEAEALRLLAAALAENPDLLNYRYIDKLAPNIRVMLVPNDSPYILPLNEANLEGEPALPAATAPLPTETSTPPTP